MPTTRPPSLFSERDFAEVARERLAIALAAAGSDGPEALARRFALSVPVLARDAVRIVEKKATVPYTDRFGTAEEAPGWFVTIAIPFTGDAALFRVTPRQFTPSWTYATLTPEAVRVTLVQGEQEDARLARSIARVVDELAVALEHLRADAAVFNEDLAARIVSAARDGEPT